MEIFLFTGSANVIGAPAPCEELPKAWHRLRYDVRLWRDGAWHASEKGAELARAVGPDMGYSVEISRGAPRSICSLRTEAEGLSATDAAHKTADAVREALSKASGRVTGALYDGVEPEAFTTDLRVALNLPNLPVYTISETGETVIPLLKVPPRVSHPARARIRTGRLLARAVMDHNDAPRPLQSWIWSTPEYQCWMEDVAETSEAAMVALPHAVAPRGAAHRRL